ncbi:MAG: hypothetical protein KatS3mg083_250 [Candidatus Dojkabacteria bacterium]|nr:MAG: hypothetical protein KatS3mg083_250 [Candidatus Dojkabacteria bacterium]
MQQALGEQYLNKELPSNVEVSQPGAPVTNVSGNNNITEEDMQQNASSRPYERNYFY